MWWAAVCEAVHKVPVVRKRCWRRQKKEHVKKITSFILHHFWEMMESTDFRVLTPRSYTSRHRLVS
jgi:hypothetical protein